MALFIVNGHEQILSNPLQNDIIKLFAGERAQRVAGFVLKILNEFAVKLEKVTHLGYFHEVKI